MIDVDKKLALQQWPKHLHLYCSVQHNRIKPEISWPQSCDMYSVHFHWHVAP
jgi:hypothetical protein